MNKCLWNKAQLNTGWKKKIQRRTLVVREKKKKFMADSNIVRSTRGRAWSVKVFHRMMSPCEWILGWYINRYRWRKKKKKTVFCSCLKKRSIGYSYAYENSSTSHRQGQIWNSINVNYAVFQPLTEAAVNIHLKILFSSPQAVNAFRSIHVQEVFGYLFWNWNSEKKKNTISNWDPKVLDILEYFLFCIYIFFIEVRFNLKISIVYISWKELNWTKSNMKYSRRQRRWLLLLRVCLRV